MKLTIGFSTCPNDTFIFDAMVNGKIDTAGIEFEPFLADVEELNRLAFSEKLDITKLSYHAYAYLSEKYVILNSGSALGFNNGPLLVTAGPVDKGEVPGLRVAIPGRYTTANLLFSIAWPEARDRHEMLFSDIEGAVLDGTVDAGLLIHENRFTYHERGLSKVADLGEFWDSLTGEPIPLGAITVRRSLGNGVAERVDEILRRSIDYAFENPGSSYEYVRRYAVEMERRVMQSHISLYVNEYTRNLGARGRHAVRRLFDEASARGVFEPVREDIFVSPATPS